VKEKNENKEKETEQLYPEQSLTCPECGYTTEAETFEVPVNYCCMCGAKL
jgi:rubrerythrin